MPSLEKYILKIHGKLSSERIEESKIMKYLQELNRLQVTLETLKATGIGKVVNRFRKHDSEIGEMASFLVAKWKELLKQESHNNHFSPSKLSPKEVTLLNRGNPQKDEVSHSSSPSETNEKEVQGKHMESNDKIRDRKTKAKAPSLQLCDVSFGCEPVNKKHKKRPTSTVAASTNMSFSESSRVDTELPPLPSALFVTNSLLPDIQPTYKPIRYPEYGESTVKKKKGVVGGEIDEQALMSRKSRTQVFSGRRVGSSGRVLMSLYDLSMKVLMDNIEALHDTGGVPYDILAPLLAKCNPQQLMHLEEYNPYFMDDTDPLWEIHCCRDFKGVTPKPNQRWRELYMSNLTERESRLKKLNEKIVAAQAAKKPERQLQLAFIKTEAKPPRDVLRKQAKFGTGKGVPLVAHVPKQTSRNTPPALFRNTGSSPTKKQAVPAPMMKKTMQLFKNQRNRATTSIKRM